MEQNGKGTVWNRRKRIHVSRWVEEQQLLWTSTKKCNNVQAELQGTLTTSSTLGQKTKKQKLIECCEIATCNTVTKNLVPVSTNAILYYKIMTEQEGKLLMCAFCAAEADRYMEVQTKMQLMNSQFKE